MPHLIKVIAASTRPTSISPGVADWVIANAPARCGLDLERINLSDWNLPMNDEPGIPARDPYLQEHTRAWSREIASAGGFIFVTPQYNWGYPAPLKNALDHLYKEWHGKPALIASYGFHGGGKCAAQLLQILEGLKMRPTTCMSEITLQRDMVLADGRLHAPERAFATGLDKLKVGYAQLIALLQVGA